MPLESVTNGIQDLNPSWPTGTDPKSQGDDHIRNTKNAVQLTFPNSTAPWQTTNKITCGGLDATTVKIENVGTPTQATDAARKGDLDAIEASLLADIAALDLKYEGITDGLDTRVDALEAQSARFQSFANIDGSDGSITDGSGDLTCTRNGIGDYTLTFTEAAASLWKQNVVANILSFPPFAGQFYIQGWAQSTTQWSIYTFQSNGQPIDTFFGIQRVAN